MFRTSYESEMFVDPSGTLLNFNFEYKQQWVHFWNSQGINSQAFLLFKKEVMLQFECELSENEDKLKLEERKSSRRSDPFLPESYFFSYFGSSHQPELFCEDLGKCCVSPQSGLDLLIFERVAAKKVKQFASTKAEATAAGDNHKINQKKKQKRKEKKQKQKLDDMTKEVSLTQEQRMQEQHKDTNLRHLIAETEKGTEVHRE